MTWLPFTNLGHTCRPKYKFGFVALPMIFMFLSFFPLFSILNSVSHALGIVENAPLKGQHNSGVFDLVFFSSFPILMLLGYLFGFALNALILKGVFGWPNEKLKKFFFDCEIPEHWLKPPKQCPRCSHTFAILKPRPKSFHQALWGGWTCPNCGCDVSTNGTARSA